MAEPAKEPKPEPTPAPAPEPKPEPEPVDVDKIRAEAQAAAARRFNEQLKAVTGSDSLDALEAANKKAAEDKLAEEGKYKELAEKAQASADAYQSKYQAATIRSALATAAVAAGAVDADMVHTLLAGSAQVGDDDAVTIGGKSPADAVAALLKDKPFLAAASGKQGSGSGAGGETGETQADLADATKKGDVQGMLAAKSKGDK